MKIKTLLSCLPGFMAGSLCWGLIRQCRDTAPLPPATVTAPALPPIPAAVASFPRDASVSAAETETLATAMDSAGKTYPATTLLGLIDGLTWDQAKSLVTRSWDFPQGHDSGATLRKLLVSRMLILDSTASLEWVLHHAPESERITLLDPLTAYWKKRDPSGWRKWLRQNEPRLRPSNPKDPAWREWLDTTGTGAKEKTATLSSATPSRPMTEVFDRLEAQMKTGRWDTAELTEWVRGTGLWKDAMNRAQSMEEPNWRDSATTSISQAWVTDDFIGWAEWADALPPDRREEAYRANLAHAGELLVGRWVRKELYLAKEATAFTATFLRADTLDRIVAATGETTQSPASELAQAWLAQDPAAAKTWLAHQAEAPWRYRLRQRQAQEIRFQDPIAALAIAAEIPSSAGRSGEMRGIFEVWQNMEPLAAAEYVEEHYPDLAEEWRRADAAR